MKWSIQEVAAAGAGIVAIAGTAEDFAAVTTDGRLHRSEPGTGGRARRDGTAGAAPAPIHVGEPAGLACRKGTVTVVTTTGERIDVDGPNVRRTPAGGDSTGPRIRHFAMAAEAPVSAWVVALDNPNGIRDDVVEVWSEETGELLCRIAPGAADGLRIDRVALDPAGRFVAWTGLAVTYDSFLDWNAGQRQLSGVAELPGGAVLFDLEIGETWSPRHHTPQPVALGPAALLAGSFVVPGSAYRRGADVTHELEGWYDFPHGAALGTGFAVASGGLLQHFDVLGTPGPEIDLGADVTALATTGAELLVGCADGTVLRARPT